MATDTAPASLKEGLAEFCRLEEERLDLEERLAANKHAMAALQEPLLEQFMELGMQNTTIGDRTIYIRFDAFCSKKKEASTEQLCAALTAFGLDYMVSAGVSMSSLKSKLREMTEQGEAIPEPIAALLNIGEVPRLVSRRK